MRYFAALLLTASPAFAHPGAHLHAQEASSLVLGLSLLAAGGVALAVVRARK